MAAMWRLATLVVVLAFSAANAITLREMIEESPLLNNRIILLNTGAVPSLESVSYEHYALRGILTSCSVEAACTLAKKAGPDYRVAFFVMDATAEEWNRYLNPEYCPNLDVVETTLHEVFANTPAEDWHLKAGWAQARGVNTARHLSNIVRMALMYKVGGLYFDADIIVMNPLAFRPVDEFYIGGVHFSRLPRGHRFAWLFMEEYVNNYDSQFKGTFGVHTVGVVMKKYCSRDIVLCGRKFQYDLVGPQWQQLESDFFPPTSNVTLADLERDMWAVHVYTSVCWGFKDMLYPHGCIANSSLLSQLTHAHCPDTTQRMRKYFLCD